MFKLPNPFRRNRHLTLMEEFGTPWSVFPANGSKPLHPENTLEAVTALMEELRPTLTHPITLVFERTGANGGIWHDALTVDNPAYAYPFLATRAGH